jgi:mannose-6-phosphate isomerase-like protein (cupin superfamily)
MENARGFETFEINPQIVTKGKKSFKLARTDLIGATVQVVAQGGENNLHAHPATDSVWIVLDGEVTFYGEGDKVVAKLERYQGLLIPRGTPYWFESSGEKPLVILHMTANDPNAKRERVNYTPRKQHTVEIAEGKFFDAKS